MYRCTCLNTNALHSMHKNLPIKRKCLSVIKMNWYFPTYKWTTRYCMKLDFYVCLLVWHFHIALCFQVVSYTQIHFVSSLTQQHSAINKTIDILWSRCTRSNIFTHRHSVFIVNLKYICQYFFSLIPSITVILILFYCIHAFLFYKKYIHMLHSAFNLETTVKDELPAI